MSTVSGQTATLSPDQAATIQTDLAERRALLRRGLHDAVARLGADVRAIVSYHLGWTDSDGRPASADSGKLLRGSMALLGAEAFGATPEAGLPGAVAVELVHNFSLLHDDIIDLDRERRHRPTAWTVFGVGPTIVAGDALLTLAVHTVLEAPSPTAAEAASVLLSATVAMIDGQALDLSYQVRRDVTTGEVGAMSEKKTGALLGCAAAIGAVLAGADRPAWEEMREFGTRLGVAFQAVDDVLGTWGDPLVTGKDVGSDLRRRKLTLPLAAALAAEGEHAEELRALMNAASDLEPWYVRRATALLDACGARGWTEEHAREQFGVAVAALDRAGVVGRPRELLHGIAAFSVWRAY
ncbi:geranylgeranyl diphosphate synthase type I [Catenulispora sp. EB89]|uniref:polyprenyl synthetase family protein n=1 Tax=Catenulispora sp. EB89 TaxID=3156257 RepID=UPI003514E5D8